MKADPPNIDNLDMARVSWVDASSSTRWDDPDVEPIDVVSVGWLQEENDEFVRLIENMQYCDEGVLWSLQMAIPKSYITRIEYLQVKKKGKTKRKTNNGAKQQ